MVTFTVITRLTHIKVFDLSFVRFGGIAQSHLFAKSKPQMTAAKF